MCPPVVMRTSVPRSRNRSRCTRCEPGHTHTLPRVDLRLVAEEDAGEQCERVGRVLVGMLAHVAVDVRAARAVVVRRDVQRDLDVIEDEPERARAR